VFTVNRDPELLEVLFDVLLLDEICWELADIVEIAPVDIIEFTVFPEA